MFYYQGAVSEISTGVFASSFRFTVYVYLLWNCLLVVVFYGGLLPKQVVSPRKSLMLSKIHKMLKLLSKKYLLWFLKNSFLFYFIAVELFLWAKFNIIALGNKCQTVIFVTLRILSIKYQNLTLRNSSSFGFPKITCFSFFAIITPFSLDYFLWIFSSATFFISILYFLLSSSMSLHLKSKLAFNILKNPLMKNVLFIIITISRYYHNLPLALAKPVAFCSGMLLTCFMCLRSMIISGFNPSNVIIVIYILFLYVVFLLNTIFRISVSLGYALDIKYTNINSILPITGKSSEKTNVFNKYFYPNNSRPNSPQQRYFLKYSLILSFLALPMLVYGAYETHMKRLAAESLADAMERLADVEEVRAGLMTREDYLKKWPRSK